MLNFPPSVRIRLRDRGDGHAQAVRRARRDREQRDEGERAVGSRLRVSATTTDRIELLFWDRSGSWLLAKRLEAGTFAWPASTDAPSLGATVRELMCVLEGIDLATAKTRRRMKRMPPSLTRRDFFHVSPPHADPPCVPEIELPTDLAAAHALILWGFRASARQAPRPVQRTSTRASSIRWRSRPSGRRSEQLDPAQLRDRRSRRCGRRSAPGEAAGAEAPAEARPRRRASTRRRPRTVRGRSRERVPRETRVIEPEDLRPDLRVLRQGEGPDFGEEHAPRSSRACGEVTR